jgi:uncharacterized membrane protein
MAIAITLLILNVQLPGRAEVARNGGLLHELGHIWPSYLAYLTAFLTIAIIWHNHHAVFGRLEHVDKTVTWANMALLLTISFLPFPTAVLADYVEGGGADARAAALFYSLVAVAMTLPWVVLWRHLSRHPELMREPFGSAFARGELRRSLVGVVIYGLSGIVALVAPLAALALFLAVAVFYAITSEGAAAVPEDGLGA